MQSSHMTLVDPDNVVYFGSGRDATGRILSNFYQCPIEYKGITYPSVEHAFQVRCLPAKPGDLECARTSS